MKLSLLILVPLVSGCGTAAVPAEPGMPIVWRDVGAWSGRTSLQTGSFLNESGALRITWEARNQTAGKDGTFQATFHSAVSGRPLSSVVASTGNGRGVSIVPEDPRPMYVVVEASDVEWHFTLEEGFPGRLAGAPD